MASETWSAILSGWPSVTDSEVNRWRFFDKIVLLKQSGRYVWWGESAHNGHMKCKLLGSRKGYQRMSGGAIFLGQPAGTGSKRRSAMGRGAQPGFKWGFRTLHRYCRRPLFDGLIAVSWGFHRLAPAIERAIPVDEPMPAVRAHQISGFLPLRNPLA